jgi:hypothetical protein
VESRKDNTDPGEPDEDESERREYSSPPCYLHEFEEQGTADRKDTAQKPAADDGGASDTPVGISRVIF